MKTIFRKVTPKIKQSLAFSPVVLIRGPRQAGKTTLVKEFEDQGYQYLSLDNLPLLYRAKEDPVGFIRNLNVPTILDEVQRVPILFLPIKEKVDLEKKPGFFLLTGSADPLLLPDIGDSLAGRMSLHSLLPLSKSEIKGATGSLIDSLWESNFDLKNYSYSNREELLEMLVKGGYPSLLTRPTAAAREEWVSNYTTIILQKDVMDLARIEHLSDFPRLLSLLAARLGGLLNREELSRTLKLSAPTVERYLVLLETLFLIHLLPAWSPNLGKRIVKSPKIYLGDTALALSLLNISIRELAENPSLFGSLFETFVFLELKKALSWSEQSFNLFHYRDHGGREVDLILERRGGEFIGIEVKARDTVGPDDFKTLKALQKELGHLFKKGFVVYSGDQCIPFGNNLFALPISYFWNSF